MGSRLGYRRGYFAALCLAAVLSGCAAGGGNGGDSGEAAGAGSSLASGKGAESAPEGTGDDRNTARAGATVVRAEEVTAKDMLEAYNSYIGDASGTGRLTGLVKNYFGITQESTIELQTSVVPYGLILHFQERPDRLTMQKAAAAIMALTGNCYSVSWDYPTDEDGNREYLCLSDSAAHLYTGVWTGDFDFSKTSGENPVEQVHQLERYLSQVEKMEELCQARARSATLDQAVAAAVLERNRYRYADGGEAFGEGHRIMGTDPEPELEAVLTADEDGIVTVYALTMYGTYQFQDGNFVKNSGSGEIPAVIRLIREPDGAYVMKDCELPGDGGDYVDSIKTMFLEEFWDRCLTVPEEDKEDLKRQEREYASEYLKTIGREAVIGDYRDFPHPLLREAGVSVEVSNQLSSGLFFADGTAVYAPFWLGNVERLEAGRRYIYEKAYDPERREIIYSKMSYDTKEAVNRLVYDSVTGKLKK